MNAVSIVVFALLVGKTTADFGPWSEYGVCQCDSQEYRSRVCDAEPCIGPSSEGQACSCIPFIASTGCPMVAGADSVYGIVADPCNCQNYIQCIYNETLAEFVGLVRGCNPCEIYDQDLLTCVADPSKPGCTFEASTEEMGICTLEAVPDFPSQFVLGGIVLECPVGAVFNVTQCTCVKSGLEIEELRQVTCLDFEVGIIASQGISVFNKDVVHINETGNCMAGSCAFFNSTAMSKLELAYFSNAFDQFTSFSVSFFFKRLTSSGIRSILDNSDCDSAASLAVTSDSGSVSSILSNSTKDTSTSTESAADDAFHHYVLSYDGNTVSTYVDTVLVKSEALGGKIDRVKAPLVVGGCVCGGACYLDGYLDTLSFIKGSLSVEDITSLNNNPEQCLP